MNKTPYLLFVGIALVLSSISNIWGQDDQHFESVRKSLANNGATLSKNTKTGNLQVDFFDCRAPSNGLQELNRLKGPKYLLLGNSLANLPIDNFFDALSNCNNVKDVVLDSVDFKLQLLEDLKKKMPTTRFVISERTAINCINSSYRISLKAKAIDSLGLKAISYDNPAGLDNRLFNVADNFIGREMYEGGWRKPLNREAVQFFRHLRNLKGVCLSGIAVVDKDLASFADAKDIEYLNLDSCKIVGDGLKEVGSKRVKILVVTNIPSLKTIPFKNFPKLERLLVSQSGISIASLRQISQCKNLVRLEMAGIQCSTTNLQEILTANSKLQQLIICKEDILAKRDLTIKHLQSKFPNTHFSLAPKGFSRQEHGWSKSK